MASIYCLTTGGVIWYVGSTKNISDRERRHRNRSSKNYGGALIPLEYDWSFKVIESCSIDDMKSRERYWIETLKPFYNRCIPGRTVSEYRKEWAQSHKEHLATLTRERRAKNQDKMLEYERAYREANREKMRKYSTEWARANRAKKKAVETLWTQ